jgi:glyceraldehyde 3-phosphate dehydrogenase
MPVRVAINGLGRTGRSFLRSAYARHADLEVVAINDLADAATLAHLLKYDSVAGRFPGAVRLDGDSIVIDDRPVRALAETDPGQLPWGELGGGQAPGRRRTQGDHLRSGQGRGAAGRDGRAGRELRRGV